MQCGLGHLRVLVLFLLSLKARGTQQSQSLVKADKELKSASPIRQEERKKSQVKYTPGVKCTPRNEVLLARIEAETQGRIEIRKTG